MSQTQTVEGTIKPDGTLELAGRLDLPPGQARVIVESVPAVRPTGESLLEVLDEIRRSQEARGYKGPTDEEMRADEAAQALEDEEYEARWAEIYRNCEPNPDAPG